MVYDMTASTSPGHATASANSPLYAIAECVRQYRALGVAPSQLVLAFPWYGYDFPCANTTRQAAGEPCKLIEHGAHIGGWERGFGTVVDTVKRAPLASMYWDDRTSTPWTEYVNPDAPAAPKPGERGQISQLWFDDARVAPQGLELCSARCLCSPLDQRFASRPCDSRLHSSTRWR